MTQTQTPSTPSTAHTQCSRTHRAALKAEDAARLAATVRDAPAEHTTISGLVLEREYGVNNLTRALRNVDEEIPPAGTFPFTRGVHKGMYRDRLWTMRQFAGFGSADDTNAALQVPARAGQDGTKANTGLSTAFDLPTLMGRDSDDALRRRGRQVRRGHRHHRGHAPPLRRHPRSTGSPSPRPSTARRVIWAMYLAMAKQRGFDWDKLGGTLQNDILKEFHAQNEFIYPPEPSVKLVVDTIEFQTQHCPVELRLDLRLPHPRGRLHRDPGTRLHPARRHGVRRGLPHRGLDIDSSPRASASSSTHNEFFEEICKLRAARRIWARMMRPLRREERALVVDEDPRPDRRVLAHRAAALNNIVRVAYQAMAGVLGGCQSLHTDSMDETLGLPTEQAVTVALRTQQILAHETGVTRTVDPLGGSWFVESLTDTMEEEALRYIDEIDDMGGVVPPLTGDLRLRGRRQSTGLLPPSDRRGQLPLQRGMEAGDRIIVGVNAYTDRTTRNAPCDILVIPDSVEIDQVDRLAQVQESRDAIRTASARPSTTIRKACRPMPTSCPPSSRAHLPTAPWARWSRPWPTSTAATPAGRSGKPHGVSLTISQPM
jgi:methylmalonyl-CoA mutase N-terminal domain/subunit